MGNRTYLATENHLLFETNNSLAVFWLLGLSASDLPRLKRDWINLDRLELELIDEEEQMEEQIESSELRELSLPITVFLKNLRSRTSFIAQMHPEVQVLYTQFCQVIEAERAVGEQCILLNLIAHRWFYSSYQEFFDVIASVYQQVEASDRIPLIYERAVVGSTTGFDTFSQHQGDQIAIHEWNVLQKKQKKPKRTFGQWWAKVTEKIIE